MSKSKQPFQGQKHTGQNAFISIGLITGALLLAGCATAAAVSGSNPNVIAAIPSFTPSPSPTFTITATEPTDTPTATDTASATFTASATATETETPVPTDTFTPTGPTLTPSKTPTGTRPPTDTKTATNTATATRTSTATRTATFTASPTYTASNTPTASDTPTATVSPTRPPSSTPDSRIQPRPTYTPYGTSAYPTGDASKLRKPPFEIKVTPHFLFTRAVPNSAPSSQYRFGMTYNGQLSPHHGEDSAPGMGIAVGAAGPGTVFWAGDDLTTIFGAHENFYGQLVVIQMADAWDGHTIYTLYGHLSVITATVGQVVNTGDLIGYTGDMGVAFGPHLHFEVRLDDPYNYYSSVRNPALWYKPNPGAGVIAGRIIGPNGRFIPGARVFINCKDALRFVDTYWDQGTPPDNTMAENFAISDIPNGNCNVSVSVNGKSYTTSVYVPPQDIAFVVIQVDGP